MPKQLPASPFVAPWIKRSWHSRITVCADVGHCRIYGRKLVGPCWLWHGWNNGKGHARVRMGDRGVYLHRLSLASYLGVSLDELDNCDHLCCQRNCFQPLHVESVTQTENYWRGNGALTQFRSNEEIEDDLAAQLRGY
jgi:hypothetical protein